MPDDSDDLELMERVKQGDDDAFAILFSRHYQRVLNIVYRYLGQVSEAEDLAQEAFVRVYRAAPRWEPKAAFTTWLYQIVGNLCLNYQRSTSRGKLRFLAGGSGDGDGLDLLASVEDSETDNVTRNMEREEQATLVRQCLDELLDNQRLALLLMHYEGLGYAEIASAMEITPGAAKALCHRARESMREKLSRQMPD